MSNQNSPTQSFAVGPLQAISTRSAPAAGDDPFAGGDGRAATFKRPVFEHTLSWDEFEKDPNRYCAQFFIGNGNYCETGITASAPPMKDHAREGYDDVYVQVEYPATFKAGVSVFRTTDVQGGRTVANSCCPHLPYLAYHRVQEVGQPVAHISLLDQQRFEVVNKSDPGAIRNGVEEGTVAYTLVLKNRETGCTITQAFEKLASFVDPAVACARLEISVDQDADLVITSGFDGTLINNSYAGYNQFQQVHTEQGPEGAVRIDPQTVALSLQTVKESEENLAKLEKCEFEENEQSTTPSEVRNQRQYRFGFAKKVRYFVDGEEITPAFQTDAPAEPAREIYAVAKVSLKAGQRLVVEDRTALVCSIDRGVGDGDVVEIAREKVTGAERYEAAKAAHVAEWQRQFSQGRIALFGGAEAMTLQAPLDLCRAALLKTVSEHNQYIAADMGAKGLHDGRYRTHNFWEMAILFWKVKAIQSPAAAKGLARLYIENIDSARAYAKSMGHAKGARFGWQTTADGKPDTQVVKWNGVAQQWDPDFSKFQPHNNWAFFYGIDQIYRVSGDQEFLVEAMPLLIELARLAGDATVKQSDGKYHTVGMMCPNEFNEKLPGSNLPNLPDTFYNNFMTAKMAARVAELLQELPAGKRDEILTRMGVTPEELAEIEAPATKTFFPITTESRAVPMVDLDGNVRDHLQVPAGTIENYDGFTQMPLVYWPSVREWLDRENAARQAEGKKPIQPRINEEGVVPRADQVLKAIELRAKLAGVVGEIMVRRGFWTQETDAGDAQITLFKEATSGGIVWKCDAESDRVFGGEVANAQIRAFAKGDKTAAKPKLNSPDNFQIGKQQGSLQTVANYSAQEVADLLRASGYDVDLDLISRNVQYYDKYVNTNGSSLSNVGSGIGKIGLGELKASLVNYDEVVHLDAKDCEPGTARQGFRAGNMAASDLMPLEYLGLEMNASNGILKLDPKVPRDIGGIELLNAAYGQQRLFVRADSVAGKLQLLLTGGTGTATVNVCGTDQQVRLGEVATFAIPVSQE